MIFNLFKMHFCVFVLLYFQTAETFNVSDLIILMAVFNSSVEPKDDPVPEWAQQEVSLGPLSRGVLESWFPHSDQSGISAHLMESMR